MRDLTGECLAVLRVAHRAVPPERTFGAEGLSLRRYSVVATRAIG